MNEPLEILHTPASGDSRHALSVVHKGTSGAAISATGGGTLLDLRNAANSQILTVSNTGGVTGTLTGGTLSGQALSGVTTLTFAPVSITDGANIATNAALGNLFRCASVGGNRTLDAPTNPTDGQIARWEFTATGAQRTVSLATGAAGFTLTAAVSSADVVIAQNKTAIVTAMYSATTTKWFLLHATVAS